MTLTAPPIPAVPRRRAPVARAIMALMPALLAGGAMLAGLTQTWARAQSPGAWDQVLAWPGLARSMTLSVVTGVGATLIATAIALLVLAMLEGRAVLAPLRALLGPMLSLPHAAAALALAVLIAPSGLVARALSPWATGWTRPPDLLILNDPGGWALMAGLVVKEVPFLLLMGLAALTAGGAARARIAAASFGYGRCAGFFLAILPTLYRRLRLSVWAVLAYSMTVVDMGMILGPGRPAPMAVQVAVWAGRPAPEDQAMAAAGALLLCAAVLATLALWAAFEGLCAALIGRAAVSGLRLRGADRAAGALALGLGYGVAGVLGAGLLGLALWSLAGPWEFPALLPDHLSTAPWARGWPSLAPAVGNSLILGIATALAAVALVLAALPGLGPPRAPVWNTALVYLPLLLPQVAVVPGMATLSLRLLGANAVWPAVVLAHLAYALPYAMMALAPAYGRLDARYGAQAASLGAGPWAVFWRVHLPMLGAPILAALAVSFAVSLAQYLPTLILGGGRLPTLATEAVAMASGGDRRLTAAMGLAQAGLPMLVFGLAVWLPPRVWRNRRGMF